MENNLYQNSFISIFDADDKPCGAGYLFSQNFLITCAHVFNQAIEESPKEIKRPSNKQITFKLSLHPSLCEIPFSAHLDTWGPTGSVFSNKDDYAILKLADSLAIGHKFPRHGTFNQGQSRGIFFYGIDGIWIRGDTYHRRNSDGLIQIHSFKNSEFTLKSGHSGTPVFDEDTYKIVGIVHSKPENKSCIGHMLPVSTIIDSWLNKKIPKVNKAISNQIRPVDSSCCGNDFM